MLAIHDDGKEKEFVKRSAGRISKADLVRNHEIGGKTLRRRQWNCWKRGRVWKECARTGGTPKCKKGERSLLL